MNWTRRDFFRAAGITSGVGLLSSFVPLPVGAQERTRKRIVLLNNAQGTDMLSWAPEGSAEGTALGEELSYQLQPLAEYRQNLVVLDGVDSIGGTTRGISGNRQETGHEALGALLTGRPVENGQGGGPSVDEVIANGLARNALEAGESPTSISALRIGRPRQWEDGRPPAPDVAGSSNSINGFYWLEAGVSAPLLWGPWETYRLLFGGNTGSADALARLRAERRSVLDVVRGELSRVRAELPRPDREYLDRHAAAIRQIEEGLDRTIQCDATLPERPQNHQVRQWNDGSAEDLINGLSLRLIATALSCGISDVACYNAQGQEGSQAVLRHLPEFGARYEGVSMDLHGNAHGMVAGDHPVDGVTTEAEAVTSRRFFADIYRWRAASIKAHLLDTMPPEVRAQTLVMWATEMSEGANHSQYNVPITLFQGDGLNHFNAGRAYRWGEYHPVDNTRPRENPGKPSNQLLSSLCHAMGLEEVEHFGDAAYPSGGLSEVVR